jgi:hypothetical protein
VRHQLFTDAYAGHFVMLDAHGRNQISSADGAADMAPTLVVLEGESYTFDQSDHTNWFHPIVLGLSPASGTGDASEVVPPPVRDAVLYSIDGQPVTGAQYMTRFT